MAKNRNISLQVSEEDYNRIKEKADSQKITVSRYMTDMALSEDSLTRAQKQEIYISLNIIKDCARQIRRLYDNDYSLNIIKEAHKLWQSLN